MQVLHQTQTKARMSLCGSLTLWKIQFIQKQNMSIESNNISSRHTLNKKNSKAKQAVTVHYVNCKKQEWVINTGT